MVFKASEIEINFKSTPKSISNPKKREKSIDTTDNMTQQTIGSVNRSILKENESHEQKRIKQIEQEILEHMNVDILNQNQVEPKGSGIKIIAELHDVNDDLKKKSKKLKKVKKYKKKKVD